VGRAGTSPPREKGSELWEAPPSDHQEGSAVKQLSSRSLKALAGVGGRGVQEPVMMGAVLKELMVWIRRKRAAQTP
jgi:hypothetical protein